MTVEQAQETKTGAKVRYGKQEFAVIENDFNRRAFRFDVPTGGEGLYDSPWFAWDICRPAK